MGHIFFKISQKHANLKDKFLEQKQVVISLFWRKLLNLL